jgi:hypothetical protein
VYVTNIIVLDVSFIALVSYKQKKILLFCLPNLILSN